jgi:hypothetical protein
MQLIDEDIRKGRYLAFVNKVGVKLGLKLGLLVLLGLVASVAPPGFEKHLPTIVVPIGLLVLGIAIYLELRRRRADKGGPRRP